MTLFISICIATYKRPVGLARLLDGLNHLEFDEIEQPGIEVVVADNDKDGSAQSICDNARENFRWSLVYGIEPQQGVTYARNRSVDMASDTSDFIVFIDDDEVPSSRWLEQLLVEQSACDADIVTGPVFPKFEMEDVPEWIVTGGFFSPPDHATGKEMEVAFTNNVLVRSDFLKKMKAPFDENLAFRGSEDVHLFMYLFKEGAKIVWNSEAIVYEFIPESRTSLKWLLDRGYYGWSTHSLVEKECFPAISVRIKRFIKGCLLLFIGSLTVIPSLFMGKHNLAKSLLYLYRGSGSLSGLFNIQGAWGGADR